MPPGPLVVFLRDPRNIFISRQKWSLRRRGISLQPPAGFGWDDMIAEGLSKYNKPRHDTPKELWGLIGMQYQLKYWQYWLELDVPKIVSKFELLASQETGPSEAERIGKYFGSKEDHVGIFNSLFMVSPTYTGHRTDWREWFGPKSVDAFYRYGGEELLALTGYEK